jgi:hypothetical protein
MGITSTSLGNFGPEVFPFIIESNEWAHLTTQQLMVSFAYVKSLSSMRSLASLTLILRKPPIAISVNSIDMVYTRII